MTPATDGDPQLRGPSGLFTDLYELTMAQAYFHAGLHERPAVFDLFFRTLPPVRNFLVACGLSRLLEELESLAFTAEDLAYLDSLGRFAPDFVASLADWRFTGTIRALPEGTPCFGNEPRRYLRDGLRRRRGDRAGARVRGAG